MSGTRSTDSGSVLKHEIQSVLEQTPPVDFELLVRMLLDTLPRCDSLMCRQHALWNYYSGDDRADDRKLCDEHVRELRGGRIGDHDEIAPVKWAEPLRLALLSVSRTENGSEARR